MIMGNILNNHKTEKSRCEKDLLRSRHRSALSTEQSFSWLKRSAEVNTLTRYTATEYRCHTGKRRKIFKGEFHQRRHESVKWVINLVE